jgi:hypothetical protein
MSTPTANQKRLVIVGATGMVDVPEQRHHRPRVLRDRKRPRPVIGEARAPLCKSHGFQAIEDADEPGGGDGGQFREALLRPSFSASTSSALHGAKSSARFRERFSKLRTYSRPASLGLKPGNNILSIYTLIMTLPRWRPDFRYLSAAAISRISNASSITGLIPRCSIMPIMRSNISTDPTTTP